jgi:hypothetical protein
VLVMATLMVMPLVMVLRITVRKMTVMTASMHQALILYQVNHLMGII